MNQQRNIPWIAAMPALLLAGVAVVAIAAPATIPNTFVPGTVADATQVNQNFQSVKTAVDDNHGRITAIENGTTLAPLDADTLQGLAANQLVRAAYAETTAIIDDFTGSDVSMFSTNVNAPVAGVLLIWASIEWEWDNVGGPQTASSLTLTIQLEVDGADVGSSMREQTFRPGAIGGSGSDATTMTVFAAAPVTAGSRLVDIRGTQPNANDTLYVRDRKIMTLFVPFGDAGTQGVLKPSLLTGPDASGANEPR